MDDLARELELARRELAPQWNEERSARLFAGTLQRRRRQAVRRTAVASILAVCAAGSIFAVLQPGAPDERVADTANPGAIAGPRSAHKLRLSDGSSAELVGERSELEVIHNSSTHVELRLLSGRAHFAVVPNAHRSFTVAVHPYRIEVIGTEFDVARSERQVEVRVEHGKVRVYGPQGAKDVAAGQVAHFDARPGQAAAEAIDPAADDLEPEPAVDDEPEPDHEAHPGRARARSSAAKRRTGPLPSWRSLSQSGDYEAAFASLSRGEVVEDDPAALMDAADAARLSNHPQSAVQYLERVVQNHGSSPVAPLAAFTLGRVYLDRLGQPDRAAQAFELSRALAPNGSLAQDALAREVEALSKGGNAHKAYLRAQKYLERYPNGRRVRAVQLYGGTD